MKKQTKSPDTKAIASAVLEEAKRMAYPANLHIDIADSILALDKYFGDGYALGHPQVLAACIIHEGLAINAPRGDMVDAVEALSNSIYELAEAVKSSQNPATS